MGCGVNTIFMLILLFALLINILIGTIRESSAFASARSRCGSRLENVVVIRAFAIRLDVTDSLLFRLLIVQYLLRIVDAS